MNAKKMFLVPSDIMQNLQSKQRMEDVEEPVKKLQYEIDDQMNHLLNAKNITDHDKSILYNQLLQLFLQRQESTPQKPQQTDVNIYRNLPDAVTQKADSDMPHSSSQHKKLSRPSPLNLDISNVLKSIPKMYRRSTENLLDYLQNNSVTWRDDGSIKIQERVYPGSNIIDIANHLARYRINRENPKGTRELIEYLKGVNTPNELIGNKEVWLEQHTPITPPTSSVKQTPKARKSKRAASVKAVDTVKGWLTYT